MKFAVGNLAAPSFRWIAAWLIAPAATLHLSVASSTDYLFDEGELSPTEFRLDSKSERQADAMAHFVTGVFQEETAGPEQALASYRQVLTIDPGFTKLAIEVAYDYLRRNQPTDAIGVLKDAVKARPEDPEPALALSSIYLRHLRKPDLAARYAEVALKIAPARFAGYEALWEIAQAQSDETAATRAISRALRAKTDDPQYWLQLAGFLVTSFEGEAGDADAKTIAQVTACLEKATPLAQDDADLLARIGDFRVIARQLEQAVPLYRQAADLKANLPNLNERLASVLIQLDRKEEAIPVLEAIIAGNPLDLRAYDQLYRLYEDRGDYEKALTSIEQALIIDKASIVRQHDLLLLLLRTGRVETAATRAGEARRLFPRSPFFTYVEARALAASGETQESVERYQEALVEASMNDASLLNALFYYDYACAAQLAGLPVKAAELFRKAIELDPNSPDPYNALGYMWVERGENLAEAEILIRKALALAPDNGAYIDSLGWLLYQRGDYAEALEELLRAVKALPEPDAVVLEHVGDAYRALNRTAEALLYWQKAAQLAPDNKTLAGKIDDATAKMAAQKPPVKR